MLNNSLVIGLAIISLVCVYLIWEHFKMAAKLKYLEMSIHETVQTVQGLVNNNLCLPPRHETQQQSHPQQPQPQQSHPQQPQQQPQSQPQQQSQPQSQQQEQKKQTEGLDISKLAGGLFQSGGGVFQNILTNLMSSLEQNENETENDDIEEISDDNDDLEEVEIEPLEITEELKEQIDSLTFNEPEEHHESNIEELGDLEEIIETQPQT